MLSVLLNKTFLYYTDIVILLLQKIVRKYKPKTNRGKADGGLMKRAVEEVMKGLSFQQVARDLNINKITLSRYVKTPKAGLANYEDEFTPNFNARQVFTKEEEEGLEEIEDTK